MPVRFNSSQIAPPGTFNPEKFPQQRQAAIKFAREGGWWEDCMVEAPVAWGEQGENSSLSLSSEWGSLNEKERITLEQIQTRMSSELFSRYRKANPLILGASFK